MSEKNQYEVLYWEVTDRLKKALLRDHLPTSAQLESEKLRVKEFFVSNGYDMKDYNDFLRDLAAYVAGLLPT